MAVDSNAVIDGLGTFLAADPGVTAALGDRNGRIRSAHRADAALPYVHIAADDQTNLGGDGPTLADVRAALHIWTRETGRTQNRAIAAAVTSALDNRTFPVAGHRVVLCRVRFARTMNDPEDGIVHGILETAIHVETV